MSTPFPTDPPLGTPPAEVETSESLVHMLLAAQHPDLANLPISRFGSGWDNDTYRLGNNLAVRLPRRLVAVENIAKEQRWLPELALQVTLPIPAPIRVGAPGGAFPWPWSIVPWVDGAAADPVGLNVVDAPVLGRFLRSLHVPCPAQAPRNPVRGVALTSRTAPCEARLRRLAVTDGESEFPVEALRAVWNRLRVIPIDTAETWIHGDLHPSNLIVAGGRLVAVCDWGDLGVGDPATDLAAAWMLLPGAAHDEFRSAYGPISAKTWDRALGWAFYLAVAFLDWGLVDDPSLALAGRTVLRRVMAEADW